VATFPQEVIDAAITSDLSWGIPASVTMAQWADESAWGTRVPTGSNNPFGIKALDGEPFVTSMTHEVVKGVRQYVQARFRKYPSLAAAFTDHARLLATAKVYAVARSYLPNQLHRFIQEMAGHYASDPEYASKLLSIINQHGLQKYDVVRPAPGQQQNIVVNVPAWTTKVSVVSAPTVGGPSAAPAAPVAVARPTPSAPPEQPTQSVAAGATLVAATGGTALAVAIAGAIPMSTVVNLAPVVDQVVLPLIMTVLTGLVSYFVPWLINAATTYFKIKVSAQQGLVIENAMQNGINLAIHKLGVTLDANASVDVKNQAVAVALDYALPKVRAEMASIGMDPATLAQRILARLPVVAAAPPPAS